MVNIQEQKSQRTLSSHIDMRLSQSSHRRFSVGYQPTVVSPPLFIHESCQEQIEGEMRTAGKERGQGGQAVHVFPVEIPLAQHGEESL